MVANKFYKIFIVFSIVDITYGCYNFEKNCSVCQETPLNLTFDQVNAKYKELVPRIWEQDIPLTCLGSKYRDIVLNLTQCGNEESSLLSIISTIFLNNFIPYLNQKPDACVMAAVVNGTLSYVKDHEDTSIQCGLTQLRDRFYKIGFENILTMRVNAGCDFRREKSPSDQETEKTNCYKDGFCYPIEDLFEIPQRPYCKIAPKLKNIVLDLYKSNNYIDKFIASCTAFSLSEITQRLFVKWNPFNIIQAVLLQSSKPVKKKCCYSLIKRTEEIRKLNDGEAVRTITDEKAFLSGTKCK